VKGIQFVVDKAGKKKAVLIDLEVWGELWEDFFDVLMAESRKDEPTVPWEVLKGEMERKEEIMASTLSKDWLRPEEDDAWKHL